MIILGNLHSGLNCRAGYATDYDSGQHAWKVTQTLFFGCLSLRPDRNMEINITIYTRSKSES